MEHDEKAFTMKKGSFCYPESPDWKKEYTFPVRENEHFYGCGETFSKFDLRGEKVRIWVAEHQNSDMISKKILRERIDGKQPKKVLPFSCYESYYAQPTFISSEKYFVHVEGTSYMEFDFTKKDEVTLRMMEDAEIIIEKADTFELLSEKLSVMLGKQPELPGWIYDGVILAVQTGNAAVEQKIRTADKYRIPVAGVWCQDWCGYRKTMFGYQVMWNWEYDREQYPELPEQIGRWKKEGIRFLGYINTFLALEKKLYHYAREHGYCVKDKNGEDYLVTITTFPAAMIDLTNPQAREWYKSIIKENMIGIGMAGWMADFGEYLPVDCVLHNGGDPRLIHNTWPALWAKLNREAIKEAGKEGEIFFFTRAGFTGTARESTLMWNGDQHVDWSYDNGLPSVIPATLSLAMSGYGIAHSDIGGYTTNENMTRSRELLLRWEEMNTFSPMMRFHEGNQPSRNVQFDTDEILLQQLSIMSRIHVALSGYLKECVRENSESGIPVMRPLFYHYEEAEAYTQSYEYLLGRDILAAPVIEEGTAVRECYLPADQWIHLFTGKKYEGGFIQVDAPVGTPPVFIREASEWQAPLVKAIQEILMEDKEERL